MTDDDIEAATAPDGAGGDVETDECSAVADGQVAALAALGNERRLEILFVLFASADWTTDVRSADPLEARFRVTLDGDELELAMDDVFTVDAPDQSGAARVPDSTDAARSP